MSDQDFTTTFTVDQTPEEVFDAINNVRGWWSGELDGSTDQLNDEFTYRYQDIHYSEQRVTESLPGERVVWLVLDSYLSFVEDQPSGRAQKLRPTSRGTAIRPRSASTTSAWPSMSVSKSARARGAPI